MKATCVLFCLILSNSEVSSLTFKLHKTDISLTLLSSKWVFIIINSLQYIF